LKEESPFPLALWSLGHQPPWLSNPDIFGACIFGADARGWGITIPCSSGTSSSQTSEMPPYCVLLHWRWGLWPDHVSPSSTNLNVLFLSFVVEKQFISFGDFFSDRIDTYVAVDLVCLRNRGIQDLPTLPSCGNLFLVFKWTLINGILSVCKPLKYLYLRQRRVT